MEEEILHIKNMVSPGCITVLKYEFGNLLGIEVKELKLGFAKVKLSSSTSIEVIKATFTSFS
jgi:hypothetical protein